MKTTLLVLVVILFSIAAVSAQTTAFVGVNVIPMDKDRVLQNQRVFVRNGVIVEISKKVKIPKDAQIIDGKGKYYTQPEMNK